MATKTGHNMSTRFTVGEDRGTLPGGRRFTMEHANDGVVVTVEHYVSYDAHQASKGIDHSTCELAACNYCGWYEIAKFELFADEVDAFATTLAKVARNEAV